jgi:tetratricopeptide (TPR) repeat protein
MRERGQSVFEAARLFEAAVARDSNWAPAWAGLAESTALLPYYAPGPGGPQVPPDSAYWARSLDGAEIAARRALELDPNNGSATVALANTLRDRWDWDAAEAAYLRALTLDPDNVEAHQQYAEFLAYVGRSEEALAAARRALALDRSAIRLNVVGYVAVQDGRFEEAIDYLREGIALDPEGRVGWMRGNLLRAYLSTGQWLAAREHILALIEPDEPLRDAITRTWPPVDEPPTEFNADLLDGSRFQNDAGAMWMALDRPEKALEVLDVFRESPPFSFSDVFYPGYDPLREDPRFQELLAIRGLAGRKPIRSTVPTRGAP